VESSLNAAMVSFRTVYSQVQKCVSLPKGSLLEKHGGTASYVDCFQVVMPNVAKTATPTTPLPSKQNMQPAVTNESSSSSSSPLLQPPAPEHVLQLSKVRSFVESFYTSTAFYPESIVLWIASKFYQLPPLETTTAVATVSSKKEKNGKKEPPSLVSSDSFGYGFFRVQEETEQEMILDSGSTQTWIRVKKLQKKGNDNSDDDEMEYAFGSIVKKDDLGLNLRVVIKLHQWYSRFLLAGAVCQHQIILSQEKTRKIKSS
jgi:hypothetical protein